MIEAATTQLSGFFLNPLGLLALLTLIPLAYFYLTKPQPDRRVMPSIDFFMENEKQGRLDHAFNTLRKNIVLILNILFIVLAATAAAGLYTNAPGSGETVIIYDRSASMHDEHAEAVSTVLDNAGDENTLIDVGEQIEVEEDLNRQEAADYVRSNPAENSGSDLRAAMQTAEAYEGEILLLSNLDEDRNTLEDYEIMAEDRGLKQIDYSTENHWGFVDISEEHVEIRNYRDADVSINLRVNSEAEEVDIAAGETKRVDTELDEGENTLELPQDGFSLDNTAYIYISEDETVPVEIRGPENPYVETAVELMEDFELAEDGDIVVLDEEEDVPDRPSVLMQGSSSEWESGDAEAAEVEITDDFNAMFETAVYELNKTGESFSSPEHALFKKEDKFYYNVDDEDFRQEYIYPVFWQNMLEQLTDRQSFEHNNRNLNEVEETQPGFHENYAANFQDEEQADIEFNSVETQETEFETPLNHGSMLALLLLLVIGLETVLLLDRGVYR